MPDADRLAARWARGSAAVFVGIALTGFAASPAQAAADEPGVNLTGCRGTVAVNVEAPVPVPTPGPASLTRPLTLVSNDVLEYNIVSTAAIAKPKWQAKVAGIPVASGTASDGGKLVGTIRMRKYAPLNLTGRYHLAITMTGTGGRCDGEVWVRLGGNPLKTAPFWIAAALTVLGLAGFWFALPRARLHGTNHRHLGRGIFSGFIVGLGAMLLLTFGDVIAFPTWWPYLAIVLVGPLLGLAVSLMGPTLGGADAIPKPVPAEQSS